MRILFYISLIFLLACSDKQDQSEPTNSDKKLIVYNWEDYLAPDLIKNFEEKFDIEVELKTFDDEERVIADFENCSSCYDVAIVSDDLVMRLKQKYLLATIDFSLLDAFSNIGQSFVDPAYDHDNKYSVPYLWGTTGVMVNKKYVKDPANSWDMLWNKKYASKIAMLNSRDEVIAAALKRLGYSLNTVMPSELDDAAKILMEQKSLVYGYLDIVEVQEALLDERVWVAHIYSGEAISLIEENEELEYYIPNEGATRWVDNMVISRGAKNKLAAHKFINYILDPRVSASIANHQWYANCNVQARKFTDDEILNSKQVYPSDKVLARCEYFEPSRDKHDLLLSQRIRQRIWERLNDTKHNEDAL